MTMPLPACVPRRGGPCFLMVDRGRFTVRLRISYANRDDSLNTIWHPAADDVVVDAVVTGSPGVQAPLSGLTPGQAMTCREASPGRLPDAMALCSLQ